MRCFFHVEVAMTKALSGAAVITNKQLARLIELATMRAAAENRRQTAGVMSKEDAAGVLEEIGLTPAAVEVAFADLALDERRARERRARTVRLALKGTGIVAGAFGGAGLLYGMFRLGRAVVYAFEAALASPEAMSNFVSVGLRVGMVIWIPAGLYMMFRER
jgi:hypothetical protein